MLIKLHDENIYPIIQIITLFYLEQEHIWIIEDQHSVSVYLQNACVAVHQNFILILIVSL